MTALCVVQLSRLFLPPNATINTPVSAPAAANPPPVGIFRRLSNAFGSSRRASAPPAAPAPQQQQMQQQQPPQDLFSQQQQQVPPPQTLPQYQQRGPLSNNMFGQRGPRGPFGHYSNLEPLPTSEELLDMESLNAAINDTANPAGEDALPRLTVSTTPEYPHTSLAENNSFYTRVNLKYAENATVSTQKKVALDVVCVLDNSGSMSGSKIESLKKAMQFVMDTLGPADRLAVVNFNSNPTTIHPLIKMTAANQTDAKAHIRNLYAEGGTDIYSGMQQGWSILEQRRTKNATSCMFLLTDGQDRDRLDQKLELARKMKAAGTSLFVFGFGTDHDSEHMYAIANAAEGSFTYIESDDMAADAFGGTIGTQTGVSLTNIQLQINCLERNIKITQLLAGRFSNTVAPDGRSATVKFVNMFLGESRDVLLKLTIPAVESAIDDYELLRASATFQIQGSTTTHNAGESNAACTVHRLPNDKIPAISDRDIEVDVQLIRIDCTTAVSNALLEADRANFTQARDILQTARAKLINSVSYKKALGTGSGNSSSTSPVKGVAGVDAALVAAAARMGSESVTLGLLQELDDALARVANRSEYERGGRAMMQECVSTNAYQRTTYNKAGRVAKYQSSASSAMQCSANVSKGFY